MNEKVDPNKELESMQLQLSNAFEFSYQQYRTINIYIIYGRACEFLLYLGLGFNSISTISNFAQRSDRAQFPNGTEMLILYIATFFSVIFFLILSYQIFGVFPIEGIYRRITKFDKSTLKLISQSNNNSNSERRDVLANNAIDPRDLLHKFSIDSRSVAMNIYNRAGAYLMAGVIIAFVGLAIFYVRPISNSGNTTDIWFRMLEFAPNFSILLFVEFVALFFLRQYRTAMDDFRYYDSIRRHREESLIILNMFAENKSIVPTQDVIKAMSLYSNAGKLGKDETTDIIETRKLYRDEFIFFEKFAEALSAIRGKKE